MFSSFISAFFQKNKNSLTVPDTMLVKKIQEFASENSLHVFKDTKIFHHEKSIEIPLLIIDPKRGIYIFEYKPWCYTEIKNLKISNLSNQESLENSLVFEEKYDFIKRRFKKILDNENIDIFNFFIMENLSKQEFERLGSLAKELTPHDKTFFSSDSKMQIKEKFDTVSKEKSDILDHNTIISTLFVQNCIISDDNSVKITSNEQNNVISHHFSNLNYIFSTVDSGKTATIRQFKS